MADSLLNPRSNPYFRDPRIRRLLISRKLINRYGDILRPSTSVPTLSPTRRIRRKRSDFNNDEEISPIRSNENHKSSSAPHRTNGKLKRRQSVSHDFSNTDRILPVFREKRLAQRSSSGYHVSRDFAHRSGRYGISSKSPDKPLSRIIIKYFGQQPLLDRGERWLHQKGDEIVVMQQHNGGENLTVFKGLVKPNHTFAFDSRRHLDYPFALAFYINGLINCRVSVCCEFKHKKNTLLGGPTGSFSICDVLNSKPCESCQFERMKRRTKSKSERIRLNQDPRYRKSVVPLLPKRSRTPSPSSSEKESSAPPGTMRPKSASPTSRRRSVTPPILTPSRSPPPISSSKDDKPMQNTSDSSYSGPYQRLPSSEASEKRPDTTSGMRPTVKSSATYKPINIDTAKGTDVSTSEESDPKITINTNLKTTPIVPTGHSSTGRSQSETLAQDVHGKKSTQSNAIDSVAKVSTNNFTSQLRQTNTSEDEKNAKIYDSDSFESNDDAESNKISQHDKPHISDAQSLDQDQDDKLKPSKSRLNDSTSDDSNDDQLKKSFEKNKTIGHKRQSSSSSSRKSGPSDHEEPVHLSEPSKGQKNLLDHNRELSSSDDDDSLYNSRKSHEQIKTNDDTHPTSTTSSAMPNSVTSNASKLPIKGSKPDELFLTSTKTTTEENERISTNSFDDFFGNKSSSKKEVSTQDLSNNPDDIHDFFKSSTTPKRRVWENLFSDDEK